VTGLLLCCHQLLTPIVDTDYLVMGAGAVSMAFVDTLLDESPNAHVVIVD
jgi:hypothetical protein